MPTYGWTGYARERILAGDILSEGLMSGGGFVLDSSKVDRQSSKFKYVPIKE